jgi:hypothetical protein
MGGWWVVAFRTRDQWIPHELTRPCRAKSVRLDLVDFHQDNKHVDTLLQHCRDVSPEERGLWFGDIPCVSAGVFKRLRDKDKISFAHLEYLVLDEPQELLEPSRGQATSQRKDLRARARSTGCWKRSKPYRTMSTTSTTGRFTRTMALSPASPPAGEQ